MVILNKWIDRQIQNMRDGSIDKQLERQRQMDIQANSQTDKETERQIYRYTGRLKSTNSTYIDRNIQTLHRQIGRQTDRKSTNYRYTNTWLFQQIFHNKSMATASSIHQRHTTQAISDINVYTLEIKNSFMFDYTLCCL